MNADDPSARIAQVFERIAATRMQDFPLSNPALRVQVVGARVWNGLWAGVLVTPWAINLLLAPAGNAEFRMPGGGNSQSWRFPSGEYAFYGLEEAGLGPCQLCSLFSPPPEFASQEQAVATAAEIMQALFVEVTPATAAAAAPGVDPAQSGAPPPAQMPFSRRDFLRGRVLG